MNADVLMTATTQLTDVVALLVAGGIGVLGTLLSTTTTSLLARSTGQTAWSICGCVGARRYRACDLENG